MPKITRQSLRSTEPTALTFVALDGTTDSFEYSGGDEILILQNDSASNVTVVLRGDEASSVIRQGISTIDVSGGKSVTIPANEYVKVTLKNASAYLSDSNKEPAITGGTVDINAALVDA